MLQFWQMKVPKLTQTYCGACGRAEGAVSAARGGPVAPSLGRECPAGRTSEPLPLQSAQRLLAGSFCSSFSAFSALACGVNAIERDTKGRHARIVSAA